MNLPSPSTPRRLSGMIPSMLRPICPAFPWPCPKGPTHTGSGRLGGRRQISQLEQQGGNRNEVANQEEVQTEPDENPQDEEAQGGEAQEQQAGGGGEVEEVPIQVLEAPTQYGGDVVADFILGGGGEEQLEQEAAMAEHVEKKRVMVIQF